MGKRTWTRPPRIAPLISIQAARNPHLYHLNFTFAIFTIFEKLAIFAIIPISQFHNFTIPQFHNFNLLNICTFFSFHSNDFPRTFVNVNLYDFHNYWARNWKRTQKTKTGITTRRLRCGKEIWGKHLKRSLAMICWMQIGWQ